MNQRDVTDKEGTTWTCVQAYGAMGDTKAAEVAKRTEGNDRQIPVVCTPDGGAQSVRLQLPLNWIEQEQLSDEELLEKVRIAAAKKNKEKEG